MANNAVLSIVQDDASARLVAKFIAAPAPSVTVASFRAHFSEFAHPISYTESAILYWLRLAGKMLNVSRWDDLLEIGTELFVAHNLTLERKAEDESKNNAPPGMTTGLVNNTSVDKVSVGYDSASAAELDAGHWNLTIYGTRFVRLARMIGAGPIQVGAAFGGIGIGAFTNAADAWPGPWFANEPNPSD